MTPREVGVNTAPHSWESRALHAFSEVDPGSKATAGQQLAGYGRRRRRVAAWGDMAARETRLNGDWEKLGCYRIELARSQRRESCRQVTTPLGSPDLLPLPVQGSHSGGSEV